MFSNLASRDFAFLIDDDIPVEDILRKVSGVDKNLISSVKLFDMYKGDKIESEEGDYPNICQVLCQVCF